MLSEVQQNIDKSVPYLARRGERTSMIAVAPYGTAALPSTVERPGRPAVQRIETSAKIVAGISFDDEMDVIGLDGEMHDAESVAIGEAERLNQWREGVFRPK